MAELAGLAAGAIGAGWITSYGLAMISEALADMRRSVERMSGGE